MKKCLKKRILPILAVFVIVITATVLPISAAVPDFLSYPGSNLLPYPYTDISSSGETLTVEGVTYQFLTNGEIIMQGQTSSNTSVVYLQKSLLLTPGTYTFASSFPNSSVLLVAWVTDTSTDNSYTVTGTFTLTSNCVCDIYIAVLANSGSFSFFMKPTLNRGDTAYPFQPYIPYWLDYQYREGLKVNGDDASYDAGYENGYAAGFDEGWKVAFGYEQVLEAPMYNWSSVEINVSYYNTATSPGVELSSNIVIQNGDSETLSTYNVLVGNAFSPLGYINFVLDRQSIPEGSTGYIYCSGCVMTVNFTDAAFIPALYTFAGTYPYNTTFDVSVFNSSTLVANKNVSVLGGGDSGEEGLYRYGATFPSVYSSIDKVVVSCLGGTTPSSPHTLEEYGFTLGILSNPNEESYVQGLRVGSTIGYDNAFDFGKQEGVKEGYQLGFTEGKAEGLQVAQLGDWTDLMTAVAEAPINAFQSLFNFEILGLDMRAAFGSILALCVVLIIIKKVLL